MSKEPVLSSQGSSTPSPRGAAGTVISVPSGARLEFQGPETPARGLALEAAPQRPFGSWAQDSLPGVSATCAGLWL